MSKYLSEEDITASDPDGPFFYCNYYIASNRQELKQWMEREQYWPNVYWISDHGNPHLITDLYSEENPMMFPGA